MQTLLHVTLLKDNSYRTGTSDTPVCEFGKGNETAEHFLLYCDKYHTAKSEMLDYV